MIMTANGVAASRNGHHATGPRSHAGKDKASRNATKHGIRSECPVIPEIESLEEWEDHRDAYITDLAPEGPIETSLAEEVASLKWKLGRVDRFEREQTSGAIRKAAERWLPGVEERVGFGESHKLDMLERIHRLEDGRFADDVVIQDILRFLVQHSIAPAPIQNLVIRYRVALKRELRQTLADLDHRQAKRAKSDVKNMEKVLDTVMGPNHQKDVVLSQDVYRKLTGAAEEGPPEADLIEAPTPEPQATVVMSAAEVSSFGNHDANGSLVTPSGSQQGIPTAVAPTSLVPAQAATVVMSAAELSSIGRNRATLCSIEISESAEELSVGVDKHGFSLDKPRTLRRRLWKEQVLKEKQEKRFRK